MLALRKAFSLDRRNTESPHRWVRVQAEPIDAGDASGADDDDDDDGNLALVHPESARLERDAEFLKGLDRVVESIERVVARLDSYHRERAEHLDAIEFLLREMLMGTVPPSASRPTVLGGVIDNDELEISLVVDETALAVDAAVEVRSRFHDRWIDGFTISEAVNTPGRRRYRLTRRSDGIPLPILFDACDVRAAEDAFSRQHAPS